MHQKNLSLSSEQNKASVSNQEISTNNQQATPSALTCSAQKQEFPNKKDSSTSLNSSQKDKNKAPFKERFIEMMNKIFTSTCGY